MHQLISNDHWSSIKLYHFCFRAFSILLGNQFLYGRNFYAPSLILYIRAYFVYLRLLHTWYYEYVTRSLHSDWWVTKIEMRPYILVCIWRIIQEMEFHYFFVLLLIGPFRIVILILTCSLFLCVPKRVGEGKTRDLMDGCPGFIDFVCRPPVLHHRGGGPNGIKNREC